MRMASGKVVDGRVELDTELPEGASVTVLALEGDETFEADPETERMLLEAIAQCHRWQTTPMTELLSDLRGPEPPRIVTASRSPLLPLGEVGLVVIVGVQLVFEHAGDGVQPLPFRRGRIDVQRSAETDAAAFRHGAHALAHPACDLASLSRVDSLAVPEDRAVWSELGLIRGHFLILNPQERSAPALRGFCPDPARRG